MNALERERALNAVRLAAKACRQVQSGGTLDQAAKGDKSPVTVADLASQALICRALAEASSGTAIIAEEDSSPLADEGLMARLVESLKAIGEPMAPDQVRDFIDRGRPSGRPARFWTLDPVDGTKGFLRREQYAIALALIEEGELVFGVLGLPNLGPTAETSSAGGTLMWAARGEGAHQGTLRGPEFAPMQVSLEAEPAAARMVESVESGHSSHDHSAQVAERIGMCRAPVRLDSQAKYAVVARGEAELYLRLPTRAGYRERIWDHAAGVLVLQEAGGRVTDIKGRALDFSLGERLEQNLGVVVSNGPFHERILEAISCLDLAD